MAPAATDSPAPPGVDEIRQPPSGVIKPPRDIQGIVEKTAGYVARNGTVFEDRIRDKEKHNPKFSFLTSSDAYASFYAWRLQEIRDGRGTAISAGRQGDAAAQEPEKPKGPAPPPEFHFSARMPNISAQDLEVVRLTALFVAKNGKSFMTTLAQRETRNYQFDFLRPQHSLNQFFSRLVDQYNILLQSNSADGEKAKRARMYELEHHSNDKFHILGRAKQRAEWVKFQEEQKAKKEEAAEKEQLEYAQIDWHDFVVVETVIFDDADDQANLAAPTSLNDLQSASLEQKAAMSLQPHDRRIEEAMPTSEDYGLFYGQHQQQPTPQPQQQPYGIPAPQYNPYEQQYPQQQQPQQVFSPAPPTPSQPTDEERAIAERTRAREQAQAAKAAAGQQPMRIREDYVPRAQAKRQNIQTALCPNCKQAFPVDEMEQHIKIELLDAQWKEQRQKAESRALATNLSTSDVAANLKRLASQRSDVFDGVTGQPLVSPEEEARRKKVAMSGYDGQPDGSMGSANAAAKKAMAAAEAERERERERGKGGTIEEQLRLIHQKAKG